MISALLAAFVAIAGFASAELSRRSDAAVGSAVATAGSANKAAGEANERAEQLRRSNLHLQQVIEAERRERLRLEARVRPRTLTADQRRVLIEALRGSGVKTINVYWINNGEPVEYATELAAAFRQAGVASTAGLNIMFSNAEGLAVSKGKGADWEKVVAAMRRAGLKVQVGDFSDVTGTAPSVVVGSKPPGEESAGAAG